MKALLELLGNPLQAPSVPTHIERIAHTQFGTVHSILKRRMMWNQDSLVLTYLKGDKLDAAGLPLYCVVAEGAGFGSGLQATDLVDNFIKPILNRYKGRARIGYVGNEGEYAHVYQWGMWLDEDMVKRFERQELPLFDEALFDCFADFHFVTRLPMYSYDFELLREKLEASAAAIHLQVQSESSMVISMPAKQVATEHFLPDADRLDYIMQLLENWNGKLDKCVGMTASKLLESESKRTEFIQRARDWRSLLINNTLPLIKAENTFVQARIMGGKPVQHLSIRMPKDETFAYLGSPDRTILKDSKEIGVYYFRAGTALFLSEASDDTIDVYLFPGSGRSYLLFEKFCRELAG